MSVSITALYGAILGLIVIALAVLNLWKVV